MEHAALCDTYYFLKVNFVENILKFCEKFQKYFEAYLENLKKVSQNFKRRLEENLKV